MNTVKSKKQTNKAQEKQSRHYLPLGGMAIYNFSTSKNKPKPSTPLSSFGDWPLRGEAYEYKDVTFFCSAGSTSISKHKVLDINYDHFFDNWGECGVKKQNSRQQFIRSAKFGVPYLSVYFLSEEKKSKSEG